MRKKVVNQKKQGLELVVLRNEFYRDNYKRALLALLLVVALNVVLVGLTIRVWLHPPQPQYFPTTADGRIINVHALSDPTVSDDFVLQWTVDAVRKAFSLDYVHWRQQLQNASSSFTPSGWRWFLNSLKSTNNLKTLVDLQMVSNAEVTGAPRILQRTVVGGHFVWKISMPLLVTYISKGHTINMPMSVTLLVLRMPVQDYPDKIAINNFLARTISNSAYQH